MKQHISKSKDISRKNSKYLKLKNKITYPNLGDAAKEMI